MTRAFIGLGSNLGTPLQQVQQASAHLNKITGCQLIARSPLYTSAAIGPGIQPEYVNGVAEIETRLEAVALLKALKDLEVRMGRTQSEVRWSPRVIDLDVLLYGDKVINLPDLQVPHPRIAQRNFVLCPLADIAPDLEIPQLGPLQELLLRCPANEIQQISQETGTGMPIE